MKTPIKLRPETPTTTQHLNETPTIKNRIETPSKLRLDTPSKLSRPMTPNRISTNNNNNLNQNLSNITRPLKSSTTTTSTTSSTSSEWSIDSFLMSKPLGRGKFGNVYYAKQKSTNHPIALKVLFKQQLQQPMNCKMIQREIEIQYRLLHPHIVRLYG
jgi:hypothetical protein